MVWIDYILIRCLLDKSKWSIVLLQVTEVPRYQHSINPTKSHYENRKQNQAQRFPEEGQEYKKFGI